MKFLIEGRVGQFQFLFSLVGLFIIVVVASVAWAFGTGLIG